MVTLSNSISPDPILPNEHETTKQTTISPLLTNETKKIDYFHSVALYTHTARRSSDGHADSAWPGINRPMDIGMRRQITGTVHCMAFRFWLLLLSI